MCKTDRESYEKYWDDISPFIKFGCIKDNKFADKMKDYVLFKNLEGKYLTLKDCLELNKTEEADNKENTEPENTSEEKDGRRSPKKKKNRKNHDFLCDRRGAAESVYQYV